jgi:N-acetylmuramoyl-L-alanine amidase
MRSKILKNLVVASFMTTILTINTYAMETVEMNLTYDGKSHKYSAKEITLMVDDRKIENLTMPPVIINDYTLVPAREVFEELGAIVGWNGATQEVYVAYGADLVVLQINNSVANLNGNPIIMDSAPKIINDKTMIPIRFASEALGFQVGWDGTNRIVSVKSPDTFEPLPEIPADNVDDSDEVDHETNQGSVVDEGASNTGDMVPAVDISNSKIEERSYPETTVSNLTPPSGSNHSVIINASSEISKVDKFLLPDNRLVIDIYNSDMQLPKTEYTVSTGAVKKIRAAQNQVTPQKVTRIVLELESGVNYAVSLSGDRKSLSVNFEKNSIQDVSFNSDGNYEYITITGAKSLGPEITSLSNPERLVVDFSFTDITAGELNANGKFVQSIRKAMFDEQTGRVVIELKSRVKYTVSSAGNSVTIRLEEPTYKNISYDGEQKIITLKKNPYNPININSIIHTDRYNDYKYILTLPGNYQDIYGYGEYEINDSNVGSISLVTTGSSTQITINEKKVFALKIYEDGENIYIGLKNPKEVYSKVVVIDPGHGGSDPGTSGHGMQEKVLTLDIGLKLKAILEKNYEKTGIKVYTTRAEDVYVSRFDRAPFANDIGDLFVSIHLNSAHPNPVPNGTETYYYPHANDSTIGISTLQTAEIFHKNLINTLQLNDRKVKKDSFTVILDTKIPSVLCEIGFLSSESDAQKLLAEEFRELTAQALYDSIIEVFGVYTPKR